MSNLDKELEGLMVNVAQDADAKYPVKDIYIVQIKQTILKELKKNKPKEEDMGEPGSYNVGYNSALDDFEAVLDTVLGGKE